MLAFERDICDCGNLRSVCSDPSVPWYPQRSMCYATAVRELTTRRVRKKYGDADSLEDLHPTDGMSIYSSTTDDSPADNFV